MNIQPPPVGLLLAFANDVSAPRRFLPHLADEQRRIREALEPARQEGLCEVVERGNATVDDLLNVFQKSHRDRIAVFHFGGHANSAELLFVSPEGVPAAAHAGGLARLLGEQRGLELVFLNGCSTEAHARGLLDAGVPMVITTSRQIEDRVATAFSVRFYTALASGASIRTAYSEAIASFEIEHGRPGKERHLSLPSSTARKTLENLPWQLYVAPGAEESVGWWSLPVAARDPLFGLPDLPFLELPAVPFKHLAAFTRDDAPVFFGRGRETRELIEIATAHDGAPVVLVFGATGAGKSSFLAAAFQPRLESSHEVLYVQRDRDLGLAGTLKRTLRATCPPSDETSLVEGWQRREAAIGRPLVVILDQAEEAWTRPLSGGMEAPQFATLLRSLFAARQARPLGRLVLSFRKEWLAEVLALLEIEKVPSHRLEVGHPDRDGIVEVVRGLDSSARLRRHYRLTIDPELPALIAADLLADPGAAVAPVLQILLSKMWTIAKREDLHSPHFTVDLYQRMKRAGILLDDFVETQLAGLRGLHAEAVDSGLLLDLLAYHTTPLGTAESRSSEAIARRYGHHSDIGLLLEGCRERYLLVPKADFEVDRMSWRLAHDILAPLVLRRLEGSNLPGQQALRILEQRAGKAGLLVDELDLARVLAGRSGMREWTAEEEELVAASRRHADLRRRRRRAVQAVAVLAITAILALALLAWWQRRQAIASKARSRDGALAALAANLVAEQPTAAALLLLEIPQPDSIPTAVDSLRKALDKPLEVAILGGHPHYVVTASFSPDGAKLLTASMNEAHLWSAATGQRIATLAGHTSQIWAASFSPDGSRLVTASHDGTARIWDAATGRPVATLAGHSAAVWNAAFSADGTRVVTASWDRTARIWDAGTGQLIATLSGHTAEVWAASFSPDGTRVVTASLDHTARVWGATTAQLLAVLKGHTDEVSSASFSPDGTRLLTASWDGAARLWDGETYGSLSLLAGHRGPIVTASFSPDGTRVVTTSADRTARLWDAANGRSSIVLAGDTDEIPAASFSRDGTHVVTASLDQTARIWEVPTGTLVRVLRGHRAGVLAASFNPDGTRVVTASRDQTARIWSTLPEEKAPVLTGHSGGIPAASWSADSARLVTASEDRTARVWDVARGRTLLTLAGHTDEVTDASFSPDGAWVGTSSRDRTARIWNATSGKVVRTLVGHAGGVWSARFSPDGSRILTASSDRTAWIWSASTGKVLVKLVGHEDTVRAARFSRDGSQVITASFDSTARLWSAATGRQLAVLRGHAAEVLAASFSADGNRVVTASRDGTARLWDAMTGRSIASPLKHSAAVLDAAFSPDGQRIVTASLNQTAQIWAVSDDQPLAVLTGHTDAVRTASFSPDGAWVVTGSFDRSARIWPAVGEYLQSVVRARTPLCLSAELRRVSLGESPQEAAARERACIACVPKFSAQLDHSPPEDWRAYLTAWEGYRRCSQESDY